MRKINYCFKLLKEAYLQSRSSSVNTNNNTNTNKSGNTIQSNQTPNITIVDSSLYDSKETKDLKDTLKQRDNEISILVNMLKKEKKKVAEQVNK